MRTIKFRGKRTDTFEWVYGWYAKGLFNLTNEVVEIDVIITRIGGYEVLPESVGQWTGLVDRQGKEIYEGDIISVDCYGYEEPEFTVTGQVIMGGLVGVGIGVGGNCEPLINIQGSYVTEYIIYGNYIDNPVLMEVE